MSQNEHEGIASAVLVEEHLVTDWYMPGEWFRSQYGPTTFAYWCEQEVRRMNGKVDRVRVVEGEDGRVALYREVL